MWKMLESKTAQVIGTWFGILSGAGTLLSWLTPEWFGQLSLSQAILVGIGFALGVSLLGAIAIAVAGYGYRLFRPLPAERGALPVLDHPERHDTYPDWADFGLLERRVVELENLPAQIASVTAILEKLGREADAHRSLDGDRWRQQVASLYDSLAAVYHRERLGELARLVEAGAAELAAPTNDKQLSYDADDWDAWQVQERGWRATLEAWCELASCYVKGASASVLTTDSAHFKMKGEAQVGQFPDPEAYIAYKEFCALLKNFRAQRGEVDREVHRVAFSGGTATSRPLYFGAAAALGGQGDDQGPG